MRPQESGMPQPQTAPPSLSPVYDDDRVRMGIYAAVLVAQIAVIYAIFAWWI